MEHSALIGFAIEPTSKADQEKLGSALARMVAEDPFLTVSIDVESGQAIMMGVSESQLDMHVDTLRRTYQIEVAVGAPQVAYREGLGRAADIDYIHDNHTGGGRQFAHVKILFEPGEPGSGFVFESRISDGAVADEYIPGVLKGIELAKDNGLLAGFPVIDFRATLHGGASDARDSSILAFEIASRAAFRQLRERGSPKLMEPIMKVEVVTPGEYMGEVMADLNSRRGHFQSSETRGEAEVVSALVPLVNMLGYAPRLRGLSRGSAQFSMLFDHYAPTPLPDGEGPTFSPAIGMRA